MIQELPKTALPFSDAKPVGAADFYFAINSTFTFIEAKLGREKLLRYWHDLGSSYYAPVIAAWKQRGMAAVAEYWKAFFNAEPGAVVEVSTTPGQVVLDVRVCPAIKHLREQGRQIVPCFCQHCYYVSEAMGAAAGITVRLEGGNGACRQTFMPHSQDQAPQDLAKIQEAR